MAKENGLVLGVKIVVLGLCSGSQGSQRAKFFFNNTWELILKYLKGFYDIRVDFFGYRMSISLLYLKFTRNDPKMAYQGHFSKFSQQNFWKHTWGPNHRAREGPCTSGNVESFFFGTVAGPLCGDQPRHYSLICLEGG